MMKKLKYKTRRTLDKYGLLRWKGENIQEAFGMSEELDPDIDHCLFGDSFTIYTEEELDKIVAKGRKELQNLPQADGGSDEWNFIVDVCFLHFETEPDGTAFGLPSNWEEVGTSTVRGLDDAFRNKGVHKHEQGTDSKINFGLGQVKKLDGSTVWGDAFRSGGTGIRYSGTGGTPNAPDSTDVMEYIKKNLMDSWQDPTRYLIVSFPKINGSSSISGYAWVGVNADHPIAGHFTKYNFMGQREYMEGFGMNANGKTPIHEAGHSLGLFHTFHNTTSCDEGHPTLSGDRVADTPPHTTNNRCGYSFFELPHNSHMSYTSSTYRKIFSAGQVERMQAVAQSKFAAMKNNPYYDWEQNETPPMIPTPTPQDGERLYSQNETVDKSHYNSDNNAWFQAYVSFDDSPQGGIFSAGGSGTGTLVGFNTIGQFIARSGDGGSVETDYAARAVLAPALFAGKEGLLRYDIFREKGAIRIRFDEGNTGEWDVDVQAEAPQGMNNWSGGDDGGVGKTDGNSVAGSELPTNQEGNTTIHWLLFSQNDNMDEYIKPPLRLEHGTYDLEIDATGLTIKQK